VKLVDTLNWVVLFNLILKDGNAEKQRLSSRATLKSRWNIKYKDQSEAQKQTKRDE